MSLILPTYNEAANLPELFRRIHAQLEPYEVIVVDDDSPDKTWEVAEHLKGEFPRVRVIRRVGKKGLSSAVTDGCDAATGEILIVMDSDLQHDPSRVARLQEKIENGASIAVASRYREGGGVGDWQCNRRWLSRLATFLTRKLPNVESTDPMSGFFAIRADTFRAARPFLVPEGFKILLEILAAVPKGTPLAEVPFQFLPRIHGESKLSLWVQVQFLKQALRIGLRRIGLTGPKIFAAIVVVLAVFFAARAWPLRLLYAQHSVRTLASVALRNVGWLQGWPISDIELRSISAGSMRIIHREHGRGADRAECFDVNLIDYTFEPCAD